MSPRAADTPPTFEQALAELEKLVDTMENQTLPLEQSVAAYERGSQLLKTCQEQLASARGKLQVLSESDGQLKPLDW